MRIEETSKEHPVFKGVEVTTKGVVKKNGKELKQSKTWRGYCSVHFSIEGVKYNKSVHRLVATTFIPNPDNLPCVGHKDENPLNNCVENLYWTSYKDNNNYGTHTLKQSISASIPVTMYNPITGEELVYFHGINEAQRETGINKAHISQCCTGNNKRRKTAGGYGWKYSETLF